MIETTCGSYPDEPSACKAFDDAIQSSDLFTTHAEVKGEILQPRFGTDSKVMRIDRLLFPSKKLLDSGWRLGAVGVEIKKSGHKIGPALAQALDYSRSVWISRSSGLLVMCRYYFIFPMTKIMGTTHSILQQNNVGGCEIVREDRLDWKKLLFHLGDGATILSYHYATKELVVNAPKCGAKSGSR